MIQREDYELSDGGCLELDPEDGTIRRRDVHGNCEEIRTVDEVEWKEWADLFQVKESDFEEKEDW